MNSIVLPAVSNLIAFLLILGMIIDLLYNDMYDKNRAWENSKYTLIISLSLHSFGVLYLIWKFLKALCNGKNMDNCFCCYMSNIFTIYITIFLVLSSSIIIWVESELSDPYIWISTLTIVSLTIVNCVFSKDENQDYAQEFIVAGNYWDKRLENP